MAGCRDSKCCKSGTIPAWRWNSAVALAVCASVVLQVLVSTVSAVGNKRMIASWPSSADSLSTVFISLSNASMSTLPVASKRSTTVDPDVAVRQEELDDTLMAMLSSQDER
jgi:hypothetical protein